MVTRISAKQGQVKPKAKQKAAPRARRARPTPRQRFARLRPNERAALSEYVARLRAKFGDRVQRVILYGSRARGEGDAESDLDVLVVVEDGDWRFHDAVAVEAVEPWLKHDALLSPIVWSQDQYEQQARWQLLFFRNLQRDGIELWTRLRKSRTVGTALKERKMT
jgi:predicted nucleotidyltransferase